MCIRDRLHSSGKVYIFGGGHVAQALVPILTSVDFSCVILENREEFCRPELFPGAEDVRMIENWHLGDYVSIGEEDYVCVMTRGHKDCLLYTSHACQEELKLIYSLVKPKYAVPVHGEYRHLKANSEIARNLGIPNENIFILQSGDVLEMDEESARVTDKVHTGAILVDGLGVGDVGNIVLRDRQHLAEDGIIIVVLTLERGSNRLLAGPDIVSRGFVYVRESEGLMEEARNAVSESLEKCLSNRHSDWNKIKLTIRDTMNDFIWKKTKRRPMIIPIIMDV